MTRYPRSMIRLVVVDDHPAIAVAVAAAATDRDDIDLVGRATSVDEAIALIDEVRPDVVLCDIWLGAGPAGLDVLRSIAADGRSRVLMLSGFEQPSFLRAAFEGGAAGYLSKASDLDEIVEAVVAVAAGATRFPDVTLRALRDAPRRPSAREIEALLLLARGSTNDEIANGLGISIKTVESHLRRLFGRYGVLSRTELALLAVREGWVSGDP
jgi:DNA-binding NarL/FixJ family response regulator